MVKIKIKKLHPDAKIPTYANPGDAGMDIYSNEDLTIKPNHRALVKTGISLEFPKEYVALIWDKSGIAKNGVTTLSGVGDSGYRGEYKVVLLNIGSKPYEIKKGQKIAQILIQPIIHPEIEEVKTLSKSKRGTGGFGSSGLN
ncbi:dUTP diphosphatase [archaeon]|nr:dUTP diphosphatase [archaeon]